MSITNSLYIGVSGLDAHSDAISIVGDNIANASTVGFKSERADFADMLGGQLDGQNLGGGTSLLAPETIETQGALEQTGNPLDMAISGNGFFVVNGAHDGQNGNFYTRDGQFALDSSGNVVKTIQNAPTGSGDQKFTWDGTDDAGNQAGPGTYTFSVQAKDSSGASITASPCIYGTVSGVRFNSSGTVFVIDGTEVPLSDILEIMQE